MLADILRRQRGGSKGFDQPWRRFVCRTPTMIHSANLASGIRKKNNPGPPGWLASMS